MVDCLALRCVIAHISSVWPCDDMRWQRSRPTLADGTKPLYEPMLTDHQRFPMASTRKQFHKKFPWKLTLWYVYGLHLYNHCTPPRINELKSIALCISNDYQTRVKQILAYARVCWCKHVTPGPRFNIKMPSYQYRKSHCGDKTVVRSSYLHNGISYTGKMTYLYWIRAQNEKV